jgi:hypothetical protein
VKRGCCEKYLKGWQSWKSPCHSHHGDSESQPASGEKRQCLLSPGEEFGRSRIFAYLIASSLDCKGESSDYSREVGQFLTS